jgi:hypothetical protein
MSDRHGKLSDEPRGLLYFFGVDAAGRQVAEQCKAELPEIVEPVMKWDDSLSTQEPSAVAHQLLEREFEMMTVQEDDRGTELPRVPASILEMSKENVGGIFGAGYVVVPVVFALPLRSPRATTATYVAFEEPVHR